MTTEIWFESPTQEEVRDRLDALEARKHAANPVFDAIAESLHTDPFALSSLIARDIEKGRDHTGGRPWPTWSTTPVEVER